MSLPSLPTRLFKLDKSGGKTIDTVDLDPSTKYYAVSHVWGSNIDWFEIPNVDVPWPIPATSKAKITFILDSCRQQQCDYIWCDILCVRQHPNIQDPEAVKDRIREVKRMTEYYAGCTATIVFGDHYETFATRWNKVDAVIKIWEKDKDGQQPQTREAVWKGFGDVDDFIGGGKGDQWFWRVWTLQETLLPPRLLTSEGIELRLDPFCKFVDWTYVALSKGILNNDQSELPHYEWIHPRQGIVNNNDWWKLSKRLRIGIGMFQSLGVTIDPLQALEITAFRQTSASYPKDALFAAYGLMDSKWYIEDHIDYTLDDVWRLTVAKLIEHNLSPLLAMAITTRGHMTWAAGRTRYMGEVIPTASKISKANMDCCRLQPTVPGASKIEFVPNFDYPFGDGSGELGNLLYALCDLTDAYDISSIIALLVRAIEEAKVPVDGNLDSLILAMQDIALANYISSGLRAVFSGWYRWIVAVGKKLFLACQFCPILKQTRINGQ